MFFIIKYVSAAFIAAIVVFGFDYSDGVYNELANLTHYSKISYCSYERTFNPGPLKDVCPKIGFCSNSKNIEITKIIRPKFREGKYSGTAYVARDDENKKVYAVFRGTFSAGDAITDFEFLQCPFVPILKNKIKSEMFPNLDDSADIKATLQQYSKGDEKLVHCGVYAAFTKFIGDIKDEIDPYLAKGYDLTVLGHSLGGGYALFAGLEFLLAGDVPLLVTYASLRIGNPKFNEWVDELFHTEENAKLISEGAESLPIPSFSRVYQATDVVPRLPPKLPGIKYTHSGLEFEITKVRLPHLKENVVFKGGSDNYKNDAINFEHQPGVYLPYYVHAHEFQRISWPCDDSDYPYP